MFEGRSDAASGRLRSGLESFSELELLLLERKMPLKRPAGDADRRETLFGGKSEGAWPREAADSESTEPERSLECADVLEAPSTDDVLGTLGGCRWSAREMDDRGEDEVFDFVRRREDLL